MRKHLQVRSGGRTASRSVMRLSEATPHVEHGTMPRNTLARPVRLRNLDGTVFAEYPSARVATISLGLSEGLLCKSIKYGHIIVKKYRAEYVERTSEPA